MRVVEKINDVKTIKVVVNGAGAAGKAIVDLLVDFDFQNIICLDSRGAIYEGREDIENNKYKKAIAEKTNKNKVKGKLDVCM